MTKYKMNKYKYDKNHQDKIQMWKNTKRQKDIYVTEDNKTKWSNEKYY